MVDEDLELERDIGEATIVYDEPDEGTVRKTVPNEHVAYFQDHWIIKTDEDEEGHDIVRRIPAQKVHYVERSVEEFEDEVQTLVDQVQSFASDLRTKIPVGSGGERQRDDEAVQPINVDIDEPDDGEPNH
jgi:ATPase subunit of ABC transporter with duplicated ATPase domains